MASAYRWFTHDNDAHDDGWLRGLIAEHGHVADTIWWVLCELVHRHGVNDKLSRRVMDIATRSQTSANVVRKVLRSMQVPSEGKVKVHLSFNSDETQVDVTIPKLNERQRKMRSHRPLEGEVDREREGDNGGFKKSLFKALQTSRECIRLPRGLASAGEILRGWVK